MKYTFLKSAAAIATLSAISFLSACSDDEAVPQETISKAPLNEYLAAKELDIEALDFNTLWSLGYEFTAKREGSVSQLGCSVPVAGKYILELYDSESGQLLTKDSVEFSAEEVAANAFAWKYKQLVSPVTVTAGKNYRVTYSLPEGADTFYRVDPQDGFELPILTDDSSIEIIQGVYGSPETFPDELWNEVVYLADVKFEYKK